MNEKIRKALEYPLGLPSLAEILFAGDRILLVPDAAITAEPDLLAEIIDFLTRSDVQIGSIAILLTENEEKTTKNLRDKLGNQINIIVHQPSRRDRLALLGVDLNDQPIALCRDLVDADMIITVGRYSNRVSKDNFGLHSTVFPRFSDQETQLRFASMKGIQRRKLKNEVEEVAKLLGILFTVQFIAQQEKTNHVVAGIPGFVDEAIKQICKQSND